MWRGSRQESEYFLRLKSDFPKAVSRLIRNLGDNLFLPPYAAFQSAWVEELWGESVSKMWLKVSK